MSIEQMLEVAQGRVWTGRQALDVGLVDEIGGLWSALDVACKLAGLPKIGEKGGKSRSFIECVYLVVLTAISACSRVC